MIKRMAVVALAAVSVPAMAQMMGDPIAALTQADTNKDGKISKAEYIATRGSHFAEMDRNKDGVLSKDDWAGEDERGGRRMERMIAQADFDKDGKVTREEFDKSPAPLFDRLDTNKDGFVDKDEIATARAEFEARMQERGN